MAHNFRTLHRQNIQHQFKDEGIECTFRSTSLEGQFFVG